MTSLILYTKNTDEEVGSIAREMNNYLDELNDIDKLAKQSIPTKETVNQIPSNATSKSG